MGSRVPGCCCVFGPAPLGALLFIDRGVLPSVLEEEICL
jgi:hypothetical protein